MEGDLGSSGMKLRFPCMCTAGKTFHYPAIAVLVGLCMIVSVDMYMPVEIPEYRADSQGNWYIHEVTLSHALDWIYLYITGLSIVGERPGVEIGWSRTDYMTTKIFVHGLDYLDSHAQSHIVRQWEHHAVGYHARSHIE